MKGGFMKPHEKCKAHGLHSLLELTQITGVSAQTLLNWEKNKPKLFKVVLIGAKEQKSNELISKS